MDIRNVFVSSGRGSLYKKGEVITELISENIQYQWPTQSTFLAPQKQKNCTKGVSAAITRHNYKLRIFFFWILIPTMY